MGRELTWHTRRHPWHQHAGLCQVAGQDVARGLAKGLLLYGCQRQEGWDPTRTARQLGRGELEVGVYEPRGASQEGAKVGRETSRLDPGGLGRSGRCGWVVVGGRAWGGAQEGGEHPRVRGTVGRKD